MRTPPSLCLGKTDLTASFHAAAVCLIPFLGAEVALWIVFVECPAEGSSPSCSLPITAIALQLIAVMAKESLNCTWEQVSYSWTQQGCKGVINSPAEGLLLYIAFSFLVRKLLPS